MKRLAVLLCAASLCLSSMAAAPPFQVTSLARDFADVWDATQGLPSADRVSRFKQTVAVRFPAFYDVAIYQGKRTQAGQDARIARMLDVGDEALYGPLFSTSKDDSGLAPRRGYSLGYLAALECGAAQRLVVETVQALLRASVAVTATP